MPRGKKKADEPGHNAALTDDERADLVALFGAKIRAQRKKADVAKASYDVERDGVNALFSTVRGELRYTRKEFEGLLATQDMGDAERRAAEVRRLELFRLGGLFVDAQLDLFSQPKDTADEKAVTYAAGKAAGLRGDDPECPGTVAAILRPEWEHGWSDGQAELGERMLRGEAFLANRGLKADVEAADLNAGSGEPEDEEADLDEAARALKRSDFMKRGAPEGADDETQVAA